MSNRKNLANGILASAVNDTTTTWPLESGYGAGMPPVPFYITATPFGQLPTQGNSEIVNVTARSGDTLTVVRGAKGTTAKAFAAGAVVANAIYDDEKWTSDNIDFPTYKHLGFASRGNTEFVGGTISDSNWRNIRNVANTADLSIPFTASGAKVMVDMSIVIWGAADAYKELRCLVDGVQVGEVISASYLQNGVAPGMGMIEFTPTAGSHTMTFQWRKNGGANMAISYRNFSAKAYEVVGGN